MTERRAPGNDAAMAFSAQPHDEPAAGRTAAVVATPLRFEQVYDAYFDFVAVAMRRLGVPAASLDDAVQETFIVVHRRLGEFEGRASLKTWLMRIALNVAADHRRLVRRKGTHEVLDDAFVDDTSTDPHRNAEHSQAIARLYRVLERLEPDHRAVFVLVELEQMTAPEIAEALQVKLNTVYSRLRVARERFQAALEADTRERA